MPGQKLHVVTGAFGYSGRYIAQRLLDAGHAVRTLTNSPPRDHPFGERIDVRPLSFADHDGLVESLSGAAVLYNTYWVRFNHKTFTFADAVRNTRALFAAAEQAGVGRVVHVSITNPSEDSVDALPRHPAAGGAVRRRRHPDQQHRLDAAEAAGLRRLWRRRLPTAADPRG
ncbi:MAG: SDR family oxidoreductase [Planctomycetota bacterium]|jgi:NADH dehydrogenase